MPFQIMDDRPGPDRMSNLPVQYMRKRAPDLNVAYRDPGSHFDAKSNSYVVSNDMEIIWMSHRYAGSPARPSCV